MFDTGYGSNSKSEYYFDMVQQNWRMSRLVFILIHVIWLVDQSEGENLFENFKKNRVLRTHLNVVRSKLVIFVQWDLHVCGVVFWIHVFQMMLTWRHFHLVSVTNGSKNPIVVKRNVKVILHVKVVKWTLAVVGVTMAVGQVVESVTRAL